MEIPHPKFQIFQGEDEQFYFRLKSVNGKVLVYSEGYTQKESAIHGIRSVKDNGVSAENYRSKTSEAGEHFTFSIIAKNGQVIATSDSYASMNTRDNGILATLDLVLRAPVEDTTTGFVAHTNPKFQIYKDNGGEYRFRLIAVNGENILGSQAYKSKSGVRTGIESVKNHSIDVANFSKREAVNGQMYFNLTSRNGAIVGSSELFSSEAGRNKSIRSVMQTAPQAPVEDFTLFPLVELIPG